MKGKELFNVLLLCCCLLILSGSFLPYISVNFPDTNAGWGARSVIQEQLPEMFEEDGTFQAAAVDLISDMQTKNKLGMVKWWFIVTLFLNLVCVLSLLMENNGKYVLILILDLVQAGLWAAGVFVVLPWGAGTLQPDCSDCICRKQLFRFDFQRRNGGADEAFPERNENWILDALWNGWCVCDSMHHCTH